MTPESQPFPSGEWMIYITFAAWNFRSHIVNATGFKIHFMLQKCT